MVHELIRVCWPRIAIRCNTLLYVGLGTVTFFCFLWFFFTFAVTSFHFLVFVSWVLFLGVLHSSHCAHTHTHGLYRDFLYIESRGFLLDKGRVVQYAIRDKRYAIRTLMVHELIRVSWPRIAIRCNTLRSWCRFGNSDVFLPFVIIFFDFLLFIFYFGRDFWFFFWFLFLECCFWGFYTLLTVLRIWYSLYFLYLQSPRYI
jgi:hypothetical protein